jgi:uncharacterized membrane protein
LAGEGTKPLFSSPARFGAAAAGVRWRQKTYFKYIYLIWRNASGASGAYCPQSTQPGETGVSAYAVLKTIHITAVILLFASIILTARRKFAADRTRDPAIIAPAQRRAVGTDFMLVTPGVVIATMAGYSMAIAFMTDSWELSWLANGQRAFSGALLIWTVILMPSQLIQSAIANKANGSMPKAYWFWRRVWTWSGALAVALLAATVYFMTFKPE